MKLHKNLNHRAFRAIEKGEKTIEIRANKARYNQPSFNTAKPGDTIKFTNTETQGSILCEIKSIKLYDSVKDLLLSEGTKKTLSSTDNLKEGVESIHSISNYKEYITRNGVFAIQIELKN